MKLTKLAVAATLVAAMAMPALAQQGGGRMQRTPEELEAAFTKGDANKDGKLDKTEYKATIPAEFAAQVDDARLATMIERRDTDKDGFVSKAEFSAPMQRPQ
ncbi:MAG: EF-hand domain-containing protein [Hyphomonadaceae bacterium]|nr:EF-hand domain-containing protein [Hyphomonadaceae bacterium]